jgi:hypothetical protein
MLSKPTWATNSKSILHFKTNTMEFKFHITADPAVTEAINNLAAAFSGRSMPAPSQAPAATLNGSNGAASKATRKATSGTNGQTSNSTSTATASGGKEYAIEEVRAKVKELRDANKEGKNKFTKEALAKTLADCGAATVSDLESKPEMLTPFMEAIFEFEKA